MFWKKCYRGIALFLGTSLYLTGCGSKAENTVTDIPYEETNQSNPVAEDGGWSGAGGCYKMEALEIDEAFSDIIVYNDEIYATFLDYEGKTSSMELQKGKDTIYETSFIERITPGSSGIWLITDVTDYTQTNSREYHLIQLDKDGQVLLDKDISRTLEGSYTIDMLEDGQGRPVLLTDQSVALFDSDGSLLGSIALEARGSSLALGGDGNVYAVVSRRDSQASSDSLSGSAAGISMFRLDMDNMTAEYVTEYKGSRVCSGNEDNLFTLLNSDGLYGVASIEADPVPIALWDELGLAFASPKSIQWLSSGRFFLLDRMIPAILSPAEPAELKMKRLLTIATFSSYSSFGSLASDYNRSSEDYIVKLVDYSQNNTLSRSDAIRALNMDIMAGKFPDMFDMSYIPQTYYADKGLLMDLSVPMKNDSEINPDDFILLDKLKTGDNLYYVPCYYYLESAAGLESVFGTGKGVSLDDYMVLQSEYSGEIMYNVTREGFLRTQASRYAATCIDWDAGSCDFESEKFLKILSSTIQVRENPEPQNPAELNFTPGEKRLAEGSLILCYQFVDSIRTLAEAEEAAGEPLSFVGLPTPDGIGGTRLEACNLLGVCSKGQTDACWAFVKYMLTTGAEKTAEYGITVNKKVLEAQIEEALSPSADAEYILPYDDADVEKLYNLLESSVYYGTASEEIINIVLEEASAMFAGAKSAEETAHIIQSRVSILVAE